MRELRECDIVAVRRLEGDGNLKAFVDIRLGKGLVIRGCTVVDGKNGLFASLPRRLGRDGRWADVVIPETDDLRSFYHEQILKAYGAAAEPAATTEDVLSE